MCRIFRSLFGLALVLIGLTSGRYAVASSDTSTFEELRTAGDRPIDIQHIRLDLKVDLPKKTIDGRATLHVCSLRPITSIRLDAVDFEVRKVAVLTTESGPEEPAHFSHDGKNLLIYLSSAWTTDEKKLLRIDYHVHEPRAGLHFFGPSAAEPQVPYTVWSHGEAINNRYWFPCLDQPNQRQTTELVVTVAEGLEVLSNGALVERRTNTDKTVTFHWRQDKPHVAYLVTLVVGPFDVVREEWDKRPVLYYVPRGRKGDVARTFGRTREMLEFFTKRFGIHYPWEKYAQVVVEQFASGGMENTSATTLNERVLRDQRAMLDDSPDGLIAHELAHQWWGDLLTCRDWAHLWLNEGFASYAEILWDEYYLGKQEYEYGLWVKGCRALAGDKERPVVDRRYPAPVSMFDARAYRKGAFILHMLRQRLGEATFWKGIQRYGMDHCFQCVDTADFRKTLERVGGHDLERFFYDWTERPGHPILDVAVDYQPDIRLARVQIQQTQRGEAFHFPLTIVFHSSDPAQAPLHFAPEITTKEHTFLIALPARPMWVEVDPEQAVLAEIKATKSRDWWLAQLQYGTTVMARIRAVQHLGQTQTSSDREALAQALRKERFWGVQVQIAAALAASGGERSREALIAGLQLPHPKVRRACAQGLGKFRHDDRAAAALKAFLEKGDSSYFVEAAALKAYAQIEQPDTVKLLLPWLERPSYIEVLRTAALEGLGRSHDWAALETLIQWTKRGKPDRCHVAALSALGELALNAHPSEGQLDRIIDTVSSSLTNSRRSIRTMAIRVLRDLERESQPALAVLQTVYQKDPEEDIRDLAKEAIDKIRGSASHFSEVTHLRQELKQLRHEHQKQRERLEKYEKAKRKAS